MNEKAELILTEMLQRVLDGVDTATDFAQREVPDVVQQLLVWHMLEAIVWAVIFAAITAFIWVIVPRHCRKVKLDPSKDRWRENTKLNLVYDENGYAHPGVVVVGTVFGASAVTFFASISNAMAALKIILAPKFYLLEYGASLVK
ncbi:hypothetical protein [Haliea salexigens]|uniref:hypothetical protein n=1 Tax=Haliea salexigens TaxID=287487 RepID=UPI0004825CCF|nr:hypothetical protein [Haliea salexigens]